MKLLQLKRSLVLRSILKKQVIPFTESEINILPAIYLLDQQNQRCSANKIETLLSSKCRTPYRKTLLSRLRAFRRDEIILGERGNIRLSMYAMNCMREIEQTLRRVRG